VSDARIGTCVCRYPYYGYNCTLKYCPVGRHNMTCSGHGVCSSSTGRCVCEPFFYGRNCAQKACPTVNGKVCNNAGSCVTEDNSNAQVGSCQCAYPYFGLDCRLKRCPTSTRVLGEAHGTQEECDGHGACNTATGNCVCDRGYGGFDCAQRRCPMSSRNDMQVLQECNGEGRCDVGTGRCVCHSEQYHGDACDLRHCPSYGELECTEHGECNHHTAECRCAPGWTGTACQRLGAQPQAAELDQLDSGDHYSSGNSENIYHPRGVCEGVHCTSSFPGLYHWADGLTADGEDGRVPGGRQRAGAQVGYQDLRVERRIPLTSALRDSHTKQAMDNEKCLTCGNVAHQGVAGWVPPLDANLGSSAYYPTGQSGALHQGTSGLNSSPYHNPYRPHGTVHNP